MTIPFEIALRIGLILMISTPSGNSLAGFSSTLGAGATTSGSTGARTASTSSLTILPLTPVPVIVDRSTPWSAAIRAASGVALGAAPLKSSTSTLWTRPFAPVPGTRPKSMPNSPAKLRAAGVARTLPPPCGLAATAGATITDVRPAGTSSIAAAGSTAGALPASTVSPSAPI